MNLNTPFQPGHSSTITTTPHPRDPTPPGFQSHLQFNSAHQQPPLRNPAPNEQLHNSKEGDLELQLDEIKLELREKEILRKLNKSQKSKRIAAIANMDSIEDLGFSRAELDDFDQKDLELELDETRLKLREKEVLRELNKLREPKRTVAIANVGLVEDLGPITYPSGADNPTSPRGNLAGSNFGEIEDYSDWNAYRHDISTIPRNARTEECNGRPGTDSPLPVVSQDPSFQASPRNGDLFQGFGQEVFSSAVFADSGAVGSSTFEWNNLTDTILPSLLAAPAEANNIYSTDFWNPQAIEMPVTMDSPSFSHGSDFNGNPDISFDGTSTLNNLSIVEDLTGFLDATIPATLINFANEISGSEIHNHVAVRGIDMHTRTDLTRSINLPAELTVSNRHKRYSSKLTTPGYFCFPVQLQRPLARNTRKPKTTEQLKNSRIVKKKGACIRCSMLRIACSGTDPCKSCLDFIARRCTSPSLEWNPCVRPSLSDRSFFAYDASNFPITIASGLPSQFDGLSLTQTFVVTVDRSLTSRIWETPSTDSPQLWALATPHLFNQLDRYLRPKSLQKMTREERTDLMEILYLVFMGVCSTLPPTGKIAQESLDSLKQALLAYMHYITPNIPLSGSQLNCVTPMAVGLYGNSVLSSILNTYLIDKYLLVGGGSSGSLFGLGDVSCESARAIL